MIQNRTSKPAHALVGLMLVVLAVFAADAFAGEGPMVVDVEVVGLQQISVAEFMSRIQTKKGQPLSEAEISRDLARLAEQGIIASADRRAVPGGVVVIFTVRAQRERAEVVKVRYKGASVSDVRDLLETKKGARLTEFMLRADANRIREHFVDKGYQEVSVKYTIEDVDTEPGKVRVIFEIRKGPKFQLKALRFPGSRQLSEKELAKVMYTKVDTWLTSRRFVRKLFDADIARLNQHYLSKGFFDAEVRLRDLAADFETGRVEAVIRVYEGPRYKINSVEFEGTEAVSAEALAGIVKMGAGRYFSAVELRSDMDAIYRHYTTGGRSYASAEVAPRLQDGPEPGTKNVTYTIEEGRPTYIRRITTRGNYKTRPKVIIREMRIEPGDMYDLQKVRDSERRLKDMRYFERVETKLQDAPPPEIGALEGVDYKDLVVDVDEATTGALSLGAGFSTNSEVVGRIAIEQRNFDISNLPDFGRYGLGALSPSRMFVGGGQRLRLVAEPGTLRSQYTLEFEEPWFFDYPVEFFFSAYYYQRLFDGYSVARTGGSVGFGRRFTRELTASIKYRRELVQISDIEANSPIEAVREQGTHDLGSWRGGLNYDTRDSVIFPTRGYVIGTYGEIGGPPAGGNVDFWKAGVNTGFNQKLYEFPEGTPHVLRASSQADFSGGAFGAPTVPIYERFFAGGIGTMRGFAWQGMGPRQTDPPTGDSPIGGQFLFLGTIEYVIPLYKEEHQLYIFNDVGTLTETIRADAFDELRDSVGVGVRLNIPGVNIPLTMNLGVPLLRQPRDKIQNFNFALGFFF